ncbi:hypothetical protein ASPWEDRAFT_39951 [Aspergillus wentii DTO 134E9]|uniref:DOC domain-containing protein n=1 Tax=Aspergillus wentii DTO 134E9 TaxID=1073089 RepID=A0A1L9RIU8_ASPWE|nr:uncharacterized protein ASPWEDRAFT_39951 [Aspergillus wentii DTO 134E9]OJJ34849.1 hypothetical protein ASPWEDRAFT_39951 [Aspergillus wentii DTO 134E9]
MPRHHLLRRHPAQDHPDTDSPQPRAAARVGNGGSVNPQLQFTTPPMRGTPQLHPSSGPIESIESPHQLHGASAPALFSLFGRGVTSRQRPQMMDEDDEEEEDEEEDDYEDGFEPDQRNFDLDPEANEVEISDEDADGMVGEEYQEEEEEEDEMMQDREKSPSPLPSNLREISSLASWTVSTHKPGCGVSALRNPSPMQYWQSDGPQPHTLSLHFFKLVAIVRIRVYLDFEMDESYTPTKMIFQAGMGGNDLVEFATWEGEAPCGWVDVPLEGVGGRSGGWVRRKRLKRTRTRGKGEKGQTKYIFSDPENQIEYDEGAYEDDDDETAEDDDDDDPYAGNVLKAMVLQMRIMENHQNGKDTHVRGFQVFARDDGRQRMGAGPSANDGRIRRHSIRKSIRGVANDNGRDGNGDADGGKVTGLEEPDWMGEPVIR